MSEQYGIERQKNIFFYFVEVTVTVSLNHLKEKEKKKSKNNKFVLTAFEAMKIFSLIILKPVVVLSCSSSWGVIPLG